MPEGDAVWRAAGRLDRALRGKELVGVDLRWGRMPEVELRGRTTLEVVPRGKHILHRIEGGWTLHSHLRMDGTWRVVPTDAVTPRVARETTIRAIVASEASAGIGRKLGMLDLLRTELEHTLVGHLGPDLLGADWNAAEAMRRLCETPDREIGAALLDQRNLAGLGTMWTAEALWEQHLNPWQLVGDVTGDHLAALMTSAHRLLAAAITADEPVIQVFGRRGWPCGRCGTRIRTAPIGKAPQQRDLSFCPGCQRAPD
ncbi:Fpg/Nei family DNA glycosylase [Yimella sp. cx-573]|nr:Fpg/Nei family DNA glycosylase [Yimella sp. cx-573]